jgi:hypothetical protein
LDDLGDGFILVEETGKDPPVGRMRGEERGMMLDQLERDE